MTEELKAQIENEALDPPIALDPFMLTAWYHGYIAGATKYAEASLMQTQIDYYENKIEQAYRNEKAAVDENSQLKARIAELEENAKILSNSVLSCESENDRLKAALTPKEQSSDHGFTEGSDWQEKQKGFPYS